MFCSSDSWDSAICLSECLSRPWVMETLYFQYDPSPYSPECVEGGSCEVRIASIQNPYRLLGHPKPTKRINQTRFTTGYLLTLRAVAGCAIGSTRPKRCPRTGRASLPLPSYPYRR
jgi:hypothetical protein